MPSLPLLRFNIGQAHVNLGEHKKAIIEFELLIEQLRNMGLPYTNIDSQINDAHIALSTAEYFARRDVPAKERLNRRLYLTQSTLYSWVYMEQILDFGLHADSPHLTTPIYRREPIPSLLIFR